MHSNPLQFKFQYLKTPEFGSIQQIFFSKTNKNIRISSFKYVFYTVRILQILRYGRSFLSSE